VSVNCVCCRERVVQRFKLEGRGESKSTLFPSIIHHSYPSIHRSTALQAEEIVSKSMIQFKGNIPSNFVLSNFNLVLGWWRTKGMNVRTSSDNPRPMPVGTPYLSHSSAFSLRIAGKSACSALSFACNKRIVTSCQ
jgi:hypothetical protein